MKQTTLVARRSVVSPSNGSPKSDQLGLGGKKNGKKKKAKKADRSDSEDEDSEEEYDDGECFEETGDDKANPDDASVKMADENLLEELAWAVARKVTSPGKYLVVVTDDRGQVWLKQALRDPDLKRALQLSLGALFVEYLFALERRTA